jgi:UDP-3-O-[3-hydroxymyristoyl] glucosamine N-acyltransferase
MWRVDQIAAALNAPFEGDGALTLSGAAEPQAARQDQLALATSPAWVVRVSEGQARVALLPPGTDWQALGLQAAIFAPRGRLAMARLTQAMDPGQGLTPGIHSSAVVDPAAALGKGVWIGPLTVIGPGARIGNNARIGGQVTIAPGAEVGQDSLILPGARIGPRVRIGARAVIQMNAVIGSDGFSFVTAAPSHAEVARKTLGTGGHVAPDDPTWHRIHSLGGVEIGDDVEIGAGATIDAGTIRPTRIGNGTKLDNLVHVAHNVVIGDHCLLCALTGVAGSTTIGDRTVMGGKSGAGDNLTIGADVVMGAGTIALSNVPAGRVMLGYPAVPMDSHIASYKALRRLPRLLARLTGRSELSKPDAND